jgi:hypothetical protein
MGFLELLQGIEITARRRDRARMTHFLGARNCPLPDGRMQARKTALQQGG